MFIREKQQQKKERKRGSVCETKRKHTVYSILNDNTTMRQYGSKKGRSFEILKKI